MAVKPIPEGYTTITPYLVVRGAAKAIEFYQKAFGARELMRFPMPDGTVAHAEIKIGNAIMMLADEMPGMGYLGPASRGGCTGGIALYVEDADALFRQAIAAGAKQIKPMEDQFYGDRSGTLADPFGHWWTIATHKEDVSPQEMKKRFEEMMKKGG
jgi:PhnB protein